ncbi:MAG: cbb3-type cytochrome c oxidase subunit 3 [bacterium]|nr:cbb3-type cytochrome c oxidase subunit 3 [bacterium]
MSHEELLIYYKVLRVGLLAAVLYGIVYYLYFTKQGKRAEDPGRRMLEEQD